MENPTPSNSEECYAKLEKLKDLSQKTVQMEKIKMSINMSLQEADEEKSALDKYKKEMELLRQEKMAHVEELRLIHTDINTMESLIKQTSADRNNLLSGVQKLLKQYKPIKDDVDKMRMEIGLEKLDVCNMEPDFNPELLNEKETTYSAPDKLSESEMNYIINDSPEKMTLVAPDKSTSHPPPMKMCLSCHQQIHRNAPICPLCKAKSRSRNPKKPKKTSKIEE